MQLPDSAHHLYRRNPVANGNPHEQALIRCWWHHACAARGRLVWEYPLFGRWFDAIWFPYASEQGVEASGLKLPARFPLNGAHIVLCEAKALQITPALIGQALVHAAFARRAGAIVDEIINFAMTVTPQMRDVAIELGLKVIVSSSPVALVPMKNDLRSGFSVI